MCNFRDSYFVRWRLNTTSSKQRQIQEELLFSFVIFHVKNRLDRLCTWIRSWLVDLEQIEKMNQTKQKRFVLSSLIIRHVQFYFTSIESSTRQVETNRRRCKLKSRQISRRPNSTMDNRWRNASNVLNLTCSNEFDNVQFETSKEKRTIESFRLDSSVSFVRANVRSVFLGNTNNHRTSRWLLTVD